MLGKTMDVHAAGMRVAAKTNVARIEGSNLRAYYKNMGTGRILWETTRVLGYRHRVGLLILALVGFIAIDHLKGLINVFYIVQGTLAG